MGQTLAEKLISKRAGRPVKAGEIVVVPVQGVMGSDVTVPLAVRSFEAMGGTKVWDGKRISVVIDHAAPAPTEEISNYHMQVRAFARKHGAKLFEGGEGICHQLMVEHHCVKPGDIFLGADSHTCTYGALGAFATGIGSTDLAAVMLTGKTWLRVPQTLKVNLTGKLSRFVKAKDVILHIVGQVGLLGATYQAIEYGGDGIEQLTLASRMTLSNMAIEMGGKAGLFPAVGLDLPYDYETILPDEDAEYARELTIDLADVQPKVAIPHCPDNVHNVDEYVGTKIDYAFIGTCTNGRLEDLHVAADILKGKKVREGVRLMIGPASKQVFLDALKDRTVEILTEAGATFLPSGCGPCVGTHFGVPGNGEVVISTANRNFPGRMGNREASVYLAAPSTVAASALTGFITHPSSVVEASA